MNSTREIPIGNYGLIGDTRTAALVAPDGSIDWLCLPRFDSPPIFGRLVGGPEAGHFAIGPDEAAATPARRRYRGNTATLETEWAVDGGRLLLTDSMVAEVSGTMLPETLLVRRITSRGRPIRVKVEVAPRFGYDRQPPRQARSQGDSVVIDHGDIALAVTTDDSQQLTPDHPIVIEVTPGQPVTVAMSATHRSPVFLVPPSVAAEYVRNTPEQIMTPVRRQAREEGLA